MIAIYLLVMCIIALLSWLYFTGRLGLGVGQQEPPRPQAAEGFQVGSTAAARFWDLVAKLENPETSAPLEQALALMEDPDPDETFKVVFPRYISLYAIAKYIGPEVYAVGGPGYAYTKDTAQARCQALGATLATLEQLTAAQVAGADWCFTAHLSNATPRYPINTTIDPGCGNGNKGIMPYDPGLAGATCYGMKPLQDISGNIKPYNATIWSIGMVNAVKQGKKALIDDYATLEREFTTTLYDQSKVSAWGANPKTQTCVQMEALKANFETQVAALRTKMQDLSGAEISAEKLKDENGSLQDRFTALCKGQSPMSDACKNLASQDVLLLPLASQFDGVNQKLYANEIDIVENLNIVSDIYDLLNCKNPGLTFDADGMIGTVDTEALQTKLQAMSPYYLSPDVLDFVTNVLTGVDTSKSTYDSTTDILANMTKTVNKIKDITAPMQPK